MKTELEIDPCFSAFDPKNWDDKIIEWEHKKFIKDKVFSILYMPINFGKVMTRLSDKAEKAGFTMLDGLCLSHHTSSWKMDIYFAVDKEIPEADNVTLSGKFYCKTYEGSFKDTGKWCKDYESIVKSKGYKANSLYMWYTTCPKCAKKYGKNYVAILSRID